MFKRIFCGIIAIMMLMAVLVSCGGSTSFEKDSEGSTILSFSQAASVSAMKELNGEKVTIIGYMSTLSPISGQFIYLMNLPYQSCPFCLPNSSTLSNTMAVYAKDGDEFNFTDRAIQIVGTIEFGDWTDEFGYQYSYRIKDAIYKEIDTNNMSEELKLWQALASTNVIADVYAMYDYVNFLCFWGEYTMNFESGADYVYPGDAKNLLEMEGAQFYEYNQPGYFDNLIQRIEEVDPEAFAKLTANIKEAEKLAMVAKAELYSNNYQTVKEYSGVFGDGRNQFRLNIYNTLKAQMDKCYMGFSNWLAEWEL